ncbi:hypothetical protein ACWC9U_15305, partial [Streptomyces sp. 900116325]
MLLSTYGSRGDAEPLVGLAVQLRAFGAGVRVCAPPGEDFTKRLADVGVPMVPVGRSAARRGTEGQRARSGEAVEIASSVRAFDGQPAGPNRHD